MAVRCRGSPLVGAVLAVGEIDCHSLALPVVGQTGIIHVDVEFVFHQFGNLAQSDVDCRPFACFKGRSNHWLLVVDYIVGDGECWSGAVVAVVLEPLHADIRSLNFTGKIERDMKMAVFVEMGQIGVGFTCHIESGPPLVPVAVHFGAVETTTVGRYRHTCVIIVGGPGRIAAGVVGAAGSVGRYAVIVHCNV